MTVPSSISSAPPAPDARNIAIVGTSVRLPGASTLEELWALVLSGDTRFSEFPRSRRGVPDSQADDEGGFTGAFVADADLFDASFFNISPREATAMDPQQRWLLEGAWHAFEDAGCGAEQLSGSDTAVLIGISSFDYYERLISAPSARKAHIGSGVSHAIAANRLSQVFNLKGPSEAIDTACSSSLVALWRAVELLRRGESRMALVGGVNLLASSTPFQAFTDAGMLSPRGVCLPFDDDASGYVRGEGAVCVVLKTVAAALEDGNRILAVIKGGAVRHGGRTQSLTAPSPTAQAAVITAALTDAGIDPVQVGYVEAHGTGTPLGDPIEARGLKRAFDLRPPHFFIGSIKAQIGHLEAAAGLAGLLKAVAALRHRMIPGNPSLTRLNRHIDLTDAPFRIPTEALPWDGERDGVLLPVGPRYAGVSSFGFGGTNVHIVLSEAPLEPAPVEVARRDRLFLLSARTSGALTALCGALAEHVAAHLAENPAQEYGYLEDVAFTLRCGRTPLDVRLALLATSADELINGLRGYARNTSVSARRIAGQRRPSRARDDANTPAERPENSPHDFPPYAEAWVGGKTIAWECVLPRGSARFVQLPLYPFSRKRFWVGSSQSDTMSTLIRAAFYRADWEPAPLDSQDQYSALPDGAVLTLVAGPAGLDLADALCRRLPGRAWRTMTFAAEREPDPAADTLSPEETAPVAAVLDLTACDADAYSRLAVPHKLERLRRHIGGALKRKEPVRLIQVTRGLQDLGTRGAAPVSFAGALEAGFYANAGAEYPNSRSKTVDLGATPTDEATDRETDADRLIRELERPDGQTVIAYAGARRFARIMRPFTVGMSEGAGRTESGPILITGGTGAIGLQIARYLVDKGCQALMLAARYTPSPEKQAFVDALRRSGADVTLHLGDLTDEPALRAAVDRFRDAYGRITRVFHCAGYADTHTPAFFQKTAASIEAVMEPKALALPALHAIFADDPPDAFVLFSSVSAVAPPLAAGVLDYAAANHALDLFAHHQHAAGHTYYRSVQWTRWRDTGLGRGAADRPDGFGRALPAPVCLAALDALLEAGEGLPPSLCVLAEEDPVFSVHPAVIHQVTQARAEVPSHEPSPAHLDFMRAGMRRLLADELKTPEETLDDEAPFEDLGVDSISLIGLIAVIEGWLGRTVNPQALIRCNSIAGVARYLATEVSPEPEPKPEPTPPEPARSKPVPLTANIPETPGRDAPFKVAVIGMACRFPDAPDLAAFWRNLAGGIDSVGPVPACRWDRAALYAPRHTHGRTVSQWGGFIGGIEYITPKLFGMTAEEAADIDPLVRLFTECGLQTVSDWPTGPEGLRGRRAGVFVGARAGRYAERIERPGKHSVAGVGQNFIAAYVSHLLDLHGPSLVLDCACSSSLASIHLACQSLRVGDCDLALAGGVETLLDEKAYLFLSAAQALSPDGRCRPFSARANGFVPGEGVGCVLLKPLAQALADDDPIYAVIDGSAINNDGHTLGVTTPGLEGQVDVIERALAKAGASPHEISYVEAHGTGTVIGDPIELQALARAFGRDPPERCGIGSVKSNIGHLLSAAGVAGFIKVALALHHRTLPPTLHCEPVNPRIGFERTPFFPVRDVCPWEVGMNARKSGISAFGFGKTNVHMILAERPDMARRPRDPAPSTSPVVDGTRIRAWHPRSEPEPAKPAAASLLALESVHVDVMAIETGDSA